MYIYWLLTVAAAYPNLSLSPFPLLSLSQVYYECLGLGDPLSFKSPRAQRLLSHLRHPVCLELGVVLWLLPALSLDRLLLAGALSTYLALAHSLDKQDLSYLCTQLNSKLQLFAEPHRGSGHSGERKEKWSLQTVMWCEAVLRLSRDIDFSVRLGICCAE